MVRTDPGITIWITPPKAQAQVVPATKAGAPPICTVGEPPAQGVVTGVHGIGVSTPSAALVAAATAGFAKLMHIAKGGMLTNGVASMIVAAGFPSTITRLTGSTCIVAGATPNEHMSIAVDVTCGLPTAPQTSAPRTDAVSWAPVVVTRQVMSRSSPWDQPRAEGSRYVKNRSESR